MDCKKFSYCFFSAILISIIFYLLSNSYDFFNILILEISNLVKNSLLIDNINNNLINNFSFYIVVSFFINLSLIYLFINLKGSNILNKKNITIIVSFLILSSLFSLYLIIISIKSDIVDNFKLALGAWSMLMTLMISIDSCLYKTTLFDKTLFIKSGIKFSLFLFLSSFLIFIILENIDMDLIKNINNNFLFINEIYNEYKNIFKYSALSLFLMSICILIKSELSMNPYSLFSIIILILLSILSVFIISNNITVDTKPTEGMIFVLIFSAMFICVLLSSVCSVLLSNLMFIRYINNQKNYQITEQIELF